MNNKPEVVVMAMNSRYREALRRIAKRFNKDGKKPVAPALSYLRQEIVLVNSQGLYTFTLSKDEQVTGKSTEQLLGRQDVFYVLDLGLKLLKEDKTKYGTGILQTYPNPTLFPDVATEFTNAHLNLVYNGKLSARVDQKILFDAIPTNKFYKVPQTLQSGTIPLSQKDPKDGFIEMEPYLILSGKRKNEIELKIPTFNGNLFAAGTTLAATGVEHKVVLEAEGFLVPGVAFD